MSAAAARWTYPLGLFDAVGVELEYMIVDRETLDVRPVADALFRVATGAEAADVEPDGPDGAISWSNELALHVVELKTQRPAPSLDGLWEPFQSHVRRIDDLLAPMGCRLLPTGMHPWMDPDRETRLWPHEYNEIYETYDRIFGCSGHGWGNLQSMHLNLPFADDEEFGRLHAAIRLVLPLLPALAASSPLVDGRRARSADHRLEVYRTNSDRVPMMAGLVIPEPIFTREAYERDILGKLYEELRPLDPAGVLRHEFANARGGMARFDRGAIEIRLLDLQECPRADLAVAALVVEVLRAIVEKRWTSWERQKQVATEPLHGVLLETIRSAERASIADATLLEAFGLPPEPIRAGDVWAALLDRVMPDHATRTPPLARMLAAGTLATRIGRALPERPTRAELRAVYAELADCAHEGSLFRVP